MSVLANQTNADYGDAYFVRDNKNITFISSINVYNGTINTSQINLDNVQMDAANLNGNPTLLLNGIPIASVSSFASSITQWASYPALAPITYTTSAGTGGAINMANVNALSNVSSQSAFFGSISTVGSLTATGSVLLGGYQFPMNATGNSMSALASSTFNITNGQIITTDFSGQPNGLYYLQAILQTASADPATCGFVLVKTGTGVSGGGTHVPSFLPTYGSAPSLANCVVCQSSSVTSNTIDIIVFGSGTTPNGLLSSTVQIAVWRIT
jgi:hypothetical protein